MVRKSRPRSSSLFLIELILAILFFTIASAVCVQIFIKSHLLSEQSYALNHAVNLSANAAETFAATEDTDMVLGTTETYYDQKFQICKKEEASYRMTVSITEERPNDLVQAKITVTELASKQTGDSKILYDLQTAKHIQRRVRP